MAYSCEEIAERLRGWLPDGDKVTGVRVLSSGHSNATYYVEGLNRVLRMPPIGIGLLPPYDMPKQHRVLDAVIKMNPHPPVPKVYELCEDKEILGDDFFIMEALSGEDFEYQAPQWLLDAPESQREHMSTQWIKAVAGLHSNPASAMPAGEVTTRDYAQACLKLADNEFGDPKLIQMLRNFVDNPLPTSGPSTPVHGDPKHGNTMWKKDGSLVALLDWEMAMVGEPLHDLGWMLCLYNQPLASAGLDLPGWLQQDQIVAHWERITGRSAAAIEKYKVMAYAKIAAINTHGIWLYRTGRITDPRYAAWDQGMPILLDILFERAGKAL